MCDPGACNGKTLLGFWQIIGYLVASWFLLGLCCSTAGMRCSGQGDGGTRRNLSKRVAWTWGNTVLSAPRAAGAGLPEDRMAGLINLIWVHGLNSPGLS